jgi:hypothetical protein
VDTRRRTDSPLAIGSEEISWDDVASIPETDGSRAYFLAVLARAYPLSLHGLVLKPTGLQRGQFEGMDFLGKLCILGIRHISPLMKPLLLPLPKSSPPLDPNYSMRLSMRKLMRASVSLSR